MVLPVVREQGIAYVIGGIFSVPGRGVFNGALFKDERMLELARATGISIAAMSVRFLMANREIATILVGASAPEEIEESVVAAQAGPLPPDLLAPYSYKEMHLIDRLTGPSSQYLLGTDQAGRDLLSRLIIGARVSVLVGLAATAVNVVVAVLVGGISGFLGGRLDLAMQRFVDAWMAFPGLLLLLTIMSIVGRGLLQIIVVLGILGGISGSRVMRSAVIGIKENDCFQAARAVGTPTSKILSHHVLPNIMAPVINCLLDQHRGGDHVLGCSGLPRLRSATQHS